MGGVSDDDMIEDFDLQELASTDQVASDLDVGFARRGVSARVVVHEDKRRGASHHGQTENADRMDKDRVVSAKRNEVMRFDASARVKQQDGETLAFGVEIWILRNLQAPVGGGLVGRIAENHVFRRGAFAERYDLVFVWLRVKPEGFHKRFETGQSGPSIFGIHGKYGNYGSYEAAGRDCPPYLVGGHAAAAASACARFCCKAAVAPGNQTSYLSRGS